MPTFQFPQVVDWAISITTAPPAPGPGGAAFGFMVEVFVQNNPQPIVLTVNTVEELSAIVGVLQIPGGRLFFNPNGRTLVKSMT